MNKINTSRQRVVLVVVKWVLLITMALPIFALFFHTYGILFKYKYQQLSFTMPYKNNSDEVFTLNKERVTAIDKLNDYKMNLSVNDFSFNVYDEVGKLEALLLDIPVMICYIILLYMMFLLVRSAEKNVFFTYKYVKRLNYIGAAFLFLSIHDYVSDRIGIYFYNKLVLGKPWLTTFPVGFSGSIFESFFFTALMVFILAQAFKQGVNLKEEQDLTI